MKSRRSSRPHTLAGLLLALGTTLPALALLGCPGPEPRARPSGSGGEGGEGAGGRATGGRATGGRAAGGEASDGAAAGGTQGGGGSSGGAGLDGSAGGARGCELGAKRCEDTVPQTCDENGEWQSGSPCPSSAPVCNSGTCGTYRLVGGVDALGKRPAATGIRLKNEGLVSEPRLCKGTVCITGGITP